MPDTDLALAGIRIRPATLADVDTMVGFRVRMFREMGWSDEPRLDEFVPAASEHLSGAFSSGNCNGFLAEMTGPEGAPTIIGSVALVWQRVAPSVRNIAGKQAYVLGMYVVPEHRRKGIARALMETTLACAADNGAPVISLHASDEGRLLYEKLGFVPAPEMRLFTEHAMPSAWVPVYDAD